MLDLLAAGATRRQFLKRSGLAARGEELLGRCSHLRSCPLIPSRLGDLPC